jgi:trans-aconitate methyltransferase
MNRIDNYRFYASGIIDHGLTAQGLRWHSQYSQEIRFHQLLTLLPAEPSSIVDAGCGFGDLYHYLQARRDNLTYVGIDSMDVMVQEAQSRTSQKILHMDILSDPLPEADFYLCSGALNILTHQGAFKFIERCFHASKRGIIFNFLEGEKTSAVYNYLRESDVNAFGRRLGGRVVFRRHYYESDCTAAFYKC